jgi:hypothetical protein
MARTHALRCFTGDRHFTAISDYWVTALDFDGNIGTKPYTIAISNHRPSEVDQEKIDTYVSFASQSPGRDLLQDQTNRRIDLHRVQSESTTGNDVGTYWGPVDPLVMTELIRRGLKYNWDNLRAEEQLRQSNIATALGAGASAGDREGPVFLDSDFISMVVEICGKTACSFVEPAFVNFINSDGQNHFASSLHHYTNAKDDTINQMIARLAPRCNPNDDRNVMEAKALNVTDDHIQSLNAIRTAGSRMWVRVGHERFHALLVSNMCNARSQGGIMGVGVRIDNTDGRFTGNGAYMTQFWPSTSHTGVPS